MANRQTVPSMGLDNVQMKRKIETSPIPVELKRKLPENNTLNMVKNVVDVTAKVSDTLNKMEEMGYALTIDGFLEGYKHQLYGTKSVKEFDDVSKKAEDDLKSLVTTDQKGQDFWNKHGENLLQANRADVEKIRAQKNDDFQKQGLADLLANNQNMLARSDGAKGEKLLSLGVNAIDESGFLDDENKNKFRQEYLNTGILNLALQDPDKAMLMADKYFSSDENGLEIKNKIATTKNLRDDFLKSRAEKQQRDNDMATYQRAVSLWQEKERGNISDAEFFVLTAENDKEVLWGEHEQRSDTPLADAYRLLKKVNNGQQMSMQDVRDAGNSIISAYKQNKINIEEASGLQNQLMLAQMDKSSSGILFDKDVDKLVDRALIADIEIDKNSAMYQKEVMEQKAKLAFDVYDAYYSRKMALADEFTGQGGTISPMVEKKIRMQAFKEIRDEMGLKENVGDEVRFSDLQKVAKMYYTGRNQTEIWQKFAQEAPYVEDKKALLKQIATAYQRRELSYPQFNSIDELQASDLARGEKFYYKGRLAVKA